MFAKSRLFIPKGTLQWQKIWAINQQQPNSIAPGQIKYLSGTGAMRHLASSAPGNSATKKKRRGGRHFAHRKNEQKEVEEHKKNKKRTKAATAALRPPATPPLAVPPALLTPTGSPHVYVARTALEDSADAQYLFEDSSSLPRLYETHEFQYMTPQDLSYDYPAHKQTEVAFLGRSNAGKSSLVNALMRRKLATTSKSPGRTQLPYYYGLFPKPKTTKARSPEALDPGLAAGYLVDLPGYGYGMAPKEVVEGWQGKTQEWMLDRRDAGVLKRLFILLDARRDGPSKLDQTVMKWAEDAQIAYSIILTKADRVSVPCVVKQVNDLCLRYASKSTLDENGTYQSPLVHVTSSQSKWGITELLESIEAEFIGMEDDGEYYNDEDDDDKEKHEVDQVKQQEIS